MTSHRPASHVEPTGPDWPILLLIVALGLMLWAPIVMLLAR